jgi:chromosome segregation ATPase
MRFEKLTDSLDAINENLNEVWQFISPYGGECFVDFQREPVTLFAEGVQLCCRPPKQGFLEFKSLSGGQQALAAVVLSVSLQRVSPMPFYIMDEIDSSLDSENVFNITALLSNESKKSGVQYILVTHRPEMYESCDKMIGIYSLQGTSKSISLDLHP